MERWRNGEIEECWKGTGTINWYCRGERLNLEKDSGKPRYSGHWIEEKLFKGTRGRAKERRRSATGVKRGR